MHCVDLVGTRLKFRVNLASELMCTCLGSTDAAARALPVAVASKQIHVWFADEGEERREDAESRQLFRIPWTFNITRSSRIREFPKDKPFSAPLIAVEQDTAPGRIYTQVRTTSSTTSEESRGSGRSALKLGFSSRPDPTSVEFRLPRRRPARQCPRRSSGERLIFVSQKTQFSPASSSTRFNRQSFDDHEAFDIDSPVSVSGFLDFA